MKFNNSIIIDSLTMAANFVYLSAEFEFDM